MIWSSRIIVFLGKLFLFVDVVVCLQAYRKTVAVNSIIQNVTVYSITSCYNDCWRNTVGCCAVGFLLSELNKKSAKSAICYMINCENDQSGEILDMEVFIVPSTIHKVSSVKLTKTGTASIKYGSRADRAVDGNYVSSLSQCAHIGSTTAARWWQFTFDFNVLIESVEISTRGDCCIGTLNNALVEVYDANQLKKCGNADLSSNRVRRVTCQKWLRGNGVQITPRPGAGDLVICEVDFYGMRV